MKKLVYLGLLVAFGFVVGCNKDANTAAQDAAKKEAATPAATNTAPAK
jgi:hypothetical protein